MRNPIKKRAEEVIESPLLQPESATEAFTIQSQLREKLVIKPLDLNKVELAAAVDVSYKKQANSASCALVVFNFKNQAIVEIITAHSEIKFPYIPGLLAFREIPPILEALKKADHDIDMIICEGHGISHPRGFGFASHLGVMLNIPTIGVAKNLLFGVVGGERHLISEFYISKVINPGNNEAIAYSVEKISGNRSLKPVYVSPGHLTDLKTSLDVFLRISGKHRMPEVLRIAHRYSGSTDPNSNS